MDKSSIEKAVDKAFDESLQKIRPFVNKELYPAAFANEYSWLHVKSVFNHQNKAMREAMKMALCEILLSEES